MKKFALLIIVVTIVLGLGTNLRAENKNFEKWLLETAEENYLLLCEDGYPSVKEAVILNIIGMKAQYPHFDYHKINIALEKLVQNHESTTVIKHKAYLASMYLRHPELFEIPEIDLGNPNACFKAIANEFENNLFVEN